MNITDANKIYKASVKACKTSKWKPSVQRFKYNELSNVAIIQQELINKTYKIGYKSHFVLNERGKTRNITGNSIKDRVVSRLICDEIMPKVEKDLIYKNGASRKNKGITFQRELLKEDLRRYYRKYHTNKGYILLIDFHHYYDNIDKEIAYKQLSKYLDDDKEEYIVKTILNSMDNGVEIGNQLSQIIGVLYPKDIDNYMTIVKRTDWSRYQDDCKIISNSKEELQELLEILKEIVKPLHIIINENKCTIQRIDKGFHYLQNYYYLTESGRVVERINKKKVIRMRRKLKSLKIMVENGERTFNSVLNMYKGWIGNNKKTMSKIQIKNMDSLFLELFRKEIYGNYNLK